MKSPLRRPNVLTHWLNKHQPPVSLVVIALAIILGLLAGGSIWLFEQFIELFHHLFFEVLGNQLDTYI